MSNGELFDDGDANSKAERNMRKGRVWLCRSLLEPPAAIIRDPGLFQLFGYLLLRATYKPRTFKLTSGRGMTTVELLPGQLAFGIPTASEFLGMKPRTLRDKLDALERMGCITRVAKPHFSLITFVNWGHYQSPKKRRKANRKANPQPNAAMQHRKANDGGKCDTSAVSVNDGNCSPQGKYASETREALPPETRNIQEGTLNNDLNKATRALRFEAADRSFAETMLGKIVARLPGFKQPNLDAWANDVRLAREQDGRSLNQLQAAFNFADADLFWRANILSPRKLREKFDQLEAKRLTSNEHRQPATPARIRSGEYDDPARYAKAAASA